MFFTLFIRYGQGIIINNKFLDIILYVDKHLAGYEAWAEICKELSTHNEHEYKWGVGETLELAIESYDKIHYGRSCFHLALSAFNEPSFEKALMKWADLYGCTIKCFGISLSLPVEMPNGQTGFICVGPCKMFYPWVKPNTSDGFKCRSCMIEM